MSQPYDVPMFGWDDMGRYIDIHDYVWEEEDE